MSTLSVDTLEDRSAAQSVDASYIVHGSHKVWGSINGTGTIAIRDSFNVTSIDDNGTGDYDFNLTNAMASTDHAFSGSCRTAATFFAQMAPVLDSGYTASGIHFQCPDRSAGTLTDTTWAMVTVLGDVA